MRPTREQIEVAAYHRWERRGWSHGLDGDDWAAAEKDLAFALNYRYVARYRLSGEPVLLGKAESGSAVRRCRFCEQVQPPALFTSEPPALPASVGNTALTAWDECDDCRAIFENHLAGAFDAFARPLLALPPAPTPSAIPAAALKALVRMALSVMPASELHNFDDAAEWVANPDHTRDVALLAGLGCHVYRTPVPVAAPFAALARRTDDETPSPYMVFFLGTAGVVFQTHLPFCPRDEDLEDEGVRGPELSLSLGTGSDFRASVCTFLPVEPVWDGRGSHEPAAFLRGARNS